MTVNATPLLQVRRSAIHGRGAFARRDLSRGTHLGVYAGRRYSAAQCLEADWSGWDSGMTCLFALSDGSTIDGAQGGNATRHLNHACDPNCAAAEEVGSDGVITLCIVTLVGVKAGDELFIDYGLIIDESESPADYPCRCGMAACRGSMAARA